MAEPTLSAFLEQALVADLEPILKEHGIESVEACCNLSKVELQQFGIKVGPRNRLLRAIQDLHVSGRGSSAELARGNSAAVAAAEPEAVTAAAEAEAAEAAAEPAASAEAGTEAAETADAPPGPAAAETTEKAVRLRPA